ncbi:unnamed protein product, partial [Iphiclides podalirius]
MSSLAVRRPQRGLKIAEPLNGDSAPFLTRPHNSNRTKLEHSYATRFFGAGGSQRIHVTVSAQRHPDAGV